MIILICFEALITEIAPQHSCHAQFVCQCKGLRDLDQLPVGIIRPKIDRRADCRRTHVIGLFHRAKQNLFKVIRIRQQLIMIDLHQKRDFVRVLTRHHAEHPKRGGNRIASAFDGKLDNVFRIKVIRVFCKACAAGMFDTLVHRQNGKIARAAQPAVVIHPG